MTRDEFVSSPCIRVCRLDPFGICIGCQRSVAEIAAWGAADATTRRAILADCARRRVTRAESPPITRPEAHHDTLPAGSDFAIAASPAQEAVDAASSQQPEGAQLPGNPGIRPQLGWEKRK
ncbi:MAG TPA: hypothetical protein DCY89_03940 [Gammaproteobacteria bacterium]|nr:hypothetical protein [Gammaproteobacteria bacterium]